MRLLKDFRGLIIFLTFFLCLSIAINGRVVDETGEPVNLDAVRAFMDVDEYTLQRLYDDGIVVLGNEQYWSLSDPRPSDLHMMEMPWLYRPQGYAPFAIETQDIGCGGVLYIETPLMKDVSVVITADACLWLFHLIFDDSLRITEKEYFDADLKFITGELHSSAISKYKNLPAETPADVREASRQLLIFTSVAQTLLNPEFVIHGGVEPEVISIVGKIEFPPDGVHCYPHEYDWSQFRPRGHYAGDEQLERYFRAMKWISKRAWQVIPLEDKWGMGVPAEGIRHDEEIMAAAWLAKQIMENPDIYEKWDRIYRITNMLVGNADSITPEVAYDGFKQVLGTNYDPWALSDNILRDAAIAEFRKDDYPASIIGLSCCQMTPAGLCGYPEKYFQLMGERYIVDSELTQKLADYYNTYIDKTPFIHGLDVAAGVMGSKNAENILRKMTTPDNPEGSELDTVVLPFREELEKEWDISDWTSNAYNSWLFSLRGLVKDIPTTAPAPEFAHTTAYGDKQVMTSLASWTHLRHDTILYAKQSFGGIICQGGRGIVEPCPELYGRLAALCGKMTDIFQQNGINLDNVDNPHFEEEAFSTRPSGNIMYLNKALEELKSRLEEFQAYAEKELRGEALTCEEQNKIHLFGSWLFNQYHYNLHETSPAQIADVHTEAYNGVLEEATGWFNPALYLYKEPGGDSIVGVGFVMSHYEFWHKSGSSPLRLNDEEWENILGPVESSTYPRAEWQNSFLHFDNADPMPSDNDECTFHTRIFWDNLIIENGFMDQTTNLIANGATDYIHTEAPDAWWLLKENNTGSDQPVDVTVQGGTGPAHLSVWRGVCYSRDSVTSASSFGKTYQARVNFTAEEGVPYLIRVASEKIDGHYSTRNVTLIVRIATASKNNICENSAILYPIPMTDYSRSLMLNSMDRPVFAEDPHPERPDAFWMLPPTGEYSAIVLSTKDSQVPTTIYIYQGSCDKMNLVKWADSHSTKGRDFAITAIKGNEASAAEHLIAVSGEPGPVVLHARAFPQITSEIQAILENEYELENADTNEDGKIDVADVITILKSWE